MNESQQAFPKAADKPRLTAYQHYEKLYDGNHFDAFSLKAEKDFTQRYTRLRYVVANFAGLISKVMADMLFQEALKIDMEKNQDFIDGFSEQNQLQIQLYESELSNSAKGDGVFKLRIGRRNEADPTAETSIILEKQDPAIYFPEFDQKNALNVPYRDVLAVVFTQNAKTYLHKEIHTPGYINHEVYLYDPNSQKIISPEESTAFGYPVTEETGVKRSLVFHIPNIRDKGFFGTSDYYDLESLQFALNNRITKVDNILDKHSDPILAVPNGVLDENGKIRAGALGLFEVDNENPGFNKPEYITWNANLESAMEEIDKLIDFLFMFSEISPATMGMDKEGGGKAESGRALKFKLLRTLAKRNRKKMYYDQAIKDILETAQQLAIANNVAINGNRITKAERPKIEWPDGIPSDSKEQVDEEVARVENGLSSRADSISRLDGVTPSEAKDKVKEIDEESKPDLPALGGAADAGVKPGDIPGKGGVVPAKPVVAVAA